MYTGCMIREHIEKRTKAPQPQALIAVMIWVIALICLNDGSKPNWAWGMVGVATLLTMYVALRFWLYYGARKG
jgi:hypothetical protein